MVFGDASRPFEATFRVNAYAYGSVAWIFILPFCGGIAGAIWGIVLEIIGISRVYGISTGKAVAAVLVPIAVVLVLFACFAGVAGLIIGFTLS